jgi:hypothetical protein
MKTGIIVLLAAFVAVLGALIVHGRTPAQARTPADPPPVYAAAAQLGCAYYPGGGGVRAWLPGVCTDATGSAMEGQPDAYQISVTNTGPQAEPVPLSVTVGFYGIDGVLISTAVENLPPGQISPHQALRAIEQDQLPGTTSVRVLDIRTR